MLDHIETGRKRGRDRGGRGGRPDHLPTGFYVEPTLVVGTNDITVAREEIFGPVVVAIPFDDEEEGIAIANDSEFGLYDYVFSGDTPRAFRVAKLLRAGHVGINTAQRNMDAPFGGFKMSGIGRDGGDYQPRGLLGDAVDHLGQLSGVRLSPTEDASTRASVVSAVKPVPVERTAFEGEHAAVGCPPASSRRWPRRRPCPRPGH